MSEVYHSLAKDITVWQIPVKVFCKNQLAIYIEFTVKYIVYFTVSCKLYATHPLYQ